MAVVVTETIAAVELAHHECEGKDSGCPVCQRAKAAAQFLDTLRMVCLVAFFSVFVLLIPEIVEIYEEFRRDLLSLVTLKVRNNS